MEYSFADIIIDISHEQLDRPFQYHIPDSMEGRVHVGDCVTVPFGAGNRQIKGYVIELKKTPDYPVEKIKDISEILDERTEIEGRLVALAGWMKSHYGGTMIQSLKTVIPVKQKCKHLAEKKIDLIVKPQELVPVIEECENKHQTARLRALKALMEEPTLPYGLMRKKLGVAPATLRSLEERGYIKITETEYFRNPVVMDDRQFNRVTLSNEQSNIITNVINDYDEHNSGKYLIHGITGSGKTEVYLGITQEMVKRGKQVIVLIPEIALTYQTLLRFYKRFGDRVSVVNSTLSAGEKYDQFVRAKNGDIDVIIGPRSALFIPFDRLGAIIIDEEHESSYKSENTPRYHARECAEYLADKTGAALILGSATPSLDAYYKTQTGEYRLFELKERLTGQSLPQVHTVDMREELRKGNRTIFSDKLTELMEDRLQKGEQTMLFINRRGVAGFISCRSCGHIIKCNHCDVSLTEHKNGTLVCHYCGHTERKPSVCPKCGSKYIAGFKVGTEQIEQNVISMFPKARVLRMDADTTKLKGSMEEMLGSFASREADILIGTQMIVKGHDFPGVTLVGILAADLSLGIGDYHAAERTFGLLTQAAGRAGRGERPGEVVIQTYQPEHYSIVAASSQDFNAFYEEDITYRRIGLYPPVWHMLAILLVSDSAERGMALAEEYKQIANASLDKKDGYTIGPTPATIGKIKDKYRHILYIKCADIEKLVKIKDETEAFVRKHPDRSVYTFYDFDPMGVL